MALFVQPGRGPGAGVTCKAEALVLERREWSEASQILTLFTDRFGRLKALAKGARRPKSRHGGGCDLLDRVAIVFYPRERGLHLLAETALTAHQPARGLRRRLAALLAGFAVAETLRECTQEHEPAPDLYTLTAVTLERLGLAPRPGCELAAYELRLLTAIGYGLQLDACAACETPLGDGPAQFAPAMGGTLCRPCVPDARGPVRPLTGPARALLQLLRDAGPDAVERTTARTVRDARGALASVLRALGERPRRTDRFAKLIEAPPAAARRRTGAA